jgi:hypothetical protein
VIILNFKIGTSLAEGEINFLSLNIQGAESEISRISLRVVMVDPCIYLKRTLYISQKKKNRPTAAYT